SRRSTAAPPRSRRRSSGVRWACEHRSPPFPRVGRGATMKAMTDTDITDERDDILGSVEGQIVLDALTRTAQQYGDHPAYSDQADGRTEWRTLTWTEVRDTARALAAALVDRGLEPGRTAAIMATNRIEHVLADHATLMAGGVPMSIYNTLSPEQVSYIAGHAEPQVVFLETADHVARWTPALA